ncbi:MAG: hypothetical protein Q7R81_03985 [Candidatus Peregrinibacteria bacterium]|nr:hypothetical protein [Candidatus Peregrinibacteria bacterium]
MALTPNVLGILIGGVAAAVLYGVSGVFSKASTREGIGIGVFLVIIGGAIALTGIVIAIVWPGRVPNGRATAYAAALGFTWALGTVCVALALVRYQIPLGKLAPLYNMNTLVAVILSLIVFAEWQQVRMAQLLLGAVLIVVGGLLVARS